MKSFPNIALVFLMAVFVSSCKKDVGEANLGDYPNDVGKIIALKCATQGCHDAKSKNAASGLDLSSWQSLFEGSNSGNAVIPFRSDFSTLFYFINTYPELGLTNEPTMPINQPKLSKEEVEIIKSWIDRGAPDIKGNIKWANNPLRKKIYVVNQGCDVVTVFDSETKLPIRYITVGNKPNVVEVPHMVKVSPDGQYWYVVFLGTSLMQKFRCSDDAFVGETTLGPSLDWNTIVISGDGKKGYSVAWTSNGRVAAVDLVNMKLLHHVGGFNFPHGVGLNATNDTIYVTAQTGNFIFKIDTAFNNADQISIDPGFPPSSSSKLDAHEIQLSPDGKDFFITCQKTNDVRVFNIATQQVTHIIPTAYFPQEFAISNNLKKLYVSSPYDSISAPGVRGSITEIDLQTYQTRMIPVGFMPHGIGVDESTNLLYVASRNIYTDGPAPHHSSACAGRNGFLNIIDLNTFKVLPKRTELSVDPYSVSVRN
jgi:YVTN family beta-propeller protein